MGDCAGCHTETGFAPTTFGLAAHAKKFALEGKHEATPCGSCHPGTKPRLDFRVAAKACGDCHENPHGEQFAAEMARGSFGACHSVKGWERPRVEHDIWPLTGAHAAASCARCHAAEGTYRGTPSYCEGCHEDQHAGQFRLSEPRRACAQCHVTSEFALPGFDHAKNTDFTLDGAHARLDCAKCHPTESLRNGTETVRWRLGYDGCKACHANPHVEDGGGKSFVGEMACTECHTTESFALAGSGGGFDHAKTGFPLEGGHEGATCGDCHGGGREVKRACASCHAEDDAHAGRLGNAFAECHTPVAWQATDLLDQHRRTRMPLTGQHALATCNDCHARQTERTWTTPPADCFACHRDELRGDVHPDHAELPRDCAQCHRPTAWSPAVIVPRTSALRVAAKVLHETKFPITSGPHRAAACVTCHPVESTPRVVSCEGCHEHAPSSPVMRRAHARVGGARGACLTCHPAGVAR